MAKRGCSDGGIRLYDVSELSNPEEIAFQKTGGIGVHHFDCDAKNACISAAIDGFHGDVLVNYDLRDPARSQEVRSGGSLGKHRSTDCAGRKVTKSGATPTAPLEALVASANPTLSTAS
jgi:hypothetical protein